MNDNEILEEAEKIIKKREIEERKRQTEEENKRYKGYVFWCSEGCGLVNRHHRCEQWSSLIAIPPAAIKAIKQLKMRDAHNHNVEAHHG